MVCGSNYERVLKLLSDLAMISYNQGPLNSSLVRAVPGRHVPWLKDLNTRFGGVTLVNVLMKRLDSVLEWPAQVIRYNCVHDHFSEERVRRQHLSISGLFHSDEPLESVKPSTLPSESF